MNAVEGFISAPTRSRLKRGIFSGVAGLRAAIDPSIAAHNDRPKAFV
jgi:hypothetical protein